MNCPNCGAEISKHTKFCSNCGYNLSNSENTGASEAAGKISEDQQTDYTVDPDVTVLTEPKTDLESESAVDSDETILIKNEPEADSDETAPAESTAFLDNTQYIPDYDPEDLDPTTISSIDPAQFSVVSSGVDSVDCHQTKDSSKTLRFVAIGLLAAVLVVGGLVITWIVRAHQNDSSQRGSVQQRIASYQQQIDAINVNPNGDSNRSDLLNQYKQLDQIAQQISSDQQAGQFRMPNGNDDNGLTILTSSISDQQKRIRNWFDADYKRRLSSNSFTDTDTANTQDKKSVDGKMTELKKLQEDLQNEKIIWGSDTSSGSAFDTYTSKVNEQIKKGQALQSGVDEKDKKEAEKKKKDQKNLEKGLTWVGLYSGDGTDGIPMEVTIQKDGVVVWRVQGEPEVRGTWSGDEKGLTLNFNGQVSQRSEPFTLTSSDGGKTISISSNSSTWNTDHLQKKDTH